MPQREERHSGKQRPGHMPALLAFDHDFVPRDPAAIRLVGVGNQPRYPVARACRGDREGVRSGQRGILAHWQRAGFGGWFGCRHQAAAAIRVIGQRSAIERGAVVRAQWFLADQRADGVVEPEEERLAQREPGGDVAPVQRKQPRHLDLARVARGIAVETCGIGFEQCLHIGGQRGVVALHGAARVKQVEREIDFGPVSPGNRAIAPAGHRRDILQGGEIVLGVGHGDPERDVRVGLAMDVRHTEFVARDLRGIGAGRRRGGGWREERFPRHQPDQDQQQPGQQPPADAFCPDQRAFPLVVVAPAR